MATTILDYTQNAGFISDPSLVDYVSEVGASLKLGPNLENFSQNFSSSAGFVFDPALAEFAGSQVRMKSTAPSAGRVGLSYESSVDATWSKDGAVTATVQGSAVVTGGKFDCRGVLNKGAYYTNNRTLAGAIKFKYTPNYDDGPSTNIDLCGQTKDNTDIDELVFFNSPGGNTIRCTFRDENGSLLAGGANTIGSYVFVDGVEVEILLQWNSASGDVSAYVGGTRIGIINLGAWDRTAASGRLYIGAMQGSPYGLSDGQYRDVIVYDSVQETGASYTPGYEVEEQYQENAVALPTNSYTGLGSVQGFVSMIATQSPLARWVVNDYYWTGSMWSASDYSYSQSGNPIDTSTNLPSHPNVGDDIDLTIVFPAGNVQEYVSNLQFFYNGTAYPSQALISSTTVNEMDQLLLFTEDSTIPALTDILHFLNINGDDFWFNGSAWVASDGSPAQSNTANEILLNMASLDLTDGKSFYLNTWLISDDGSVTPTIKTVTYIFNFNPPFLVPPKITILYGQIFRLDGVIASNAILRVRSQPIEEGGIPFVAEDGIVQPGYVDIPTDPNGVIIQDLVISSLYSRVFKFTLIYTETPTSTKQLNEEWGSREIPDEPNVNVNTLWS